VADVARRVRRKLEVDAVDDGVDRGDAHALGAHDRGVVTGPDEHAAARLAEPFANGGNERELGHHSCDLRPATCDPIQ
jgi:hypothetical protein